MPIANAVATDDPEIAANSAHDTTATSPSDPLIPPSHAADRSTSACATPPRRMNAAAITNNGSAISVVEFSWSIMFCATPTIGWPETKNRIAAQVPSTRKIGMPAASRPKNITRNPTTHIYLDGGSARSGGASCEMTWPIVITRGSKRNM